MTFTPRDVKDQVVQYPNRYKIDGVSHAIEPDFGTVTEAGTPINRAYLQPIEDYLANLMSGGLAFKNLTLFKIKTTTSISGVEEVGVTLTLTSPNAPITTTYITNSDGYFYLLLPYGSYSFSWEASRLGFQSYTYNFSSTSGECYKEIGPIFTEATNKKAYIDTSGSYTLADFIKAKGVVDLFLVGGGAGGADSSSGNVGYNGTGGGGGYTQTWLNIDVSAVGALTAVIGAGGIHAGSLGGTGGSTSFLGHSVNGGSGGIFNSATTAPGGNGGSGGGGLVSGTGYDGGSNGGNGLGSNGGTGQGTTTKEFGASDGTQYSGGGGTPPSGVGGAGGGGTGVGYSDTTPNPHNATYYGGGGGGGQRTSTASLRYGGDGYKGRAVIRWS